MTVLFLRSSAFLPSEGGKGYLGLTCCLVTQSCPTLCDPMDYSPPDSSVHGILQAGILEWVAIPFSKGSSWPRDQIWVSCIAGRLFTDWVTRESLSYQLNSRLDLDFTKLSINVHSFCSRIQPSVPHFTEISYLLCLLWSVTISMFFSVVSAFRILPNSSHKGLPMFPSQNLIVQLLHWVLDPFWVTVCTQCEAGIQLHPFTWDCPDVSASFVENTSSFPTEWSWQHY